MLMEGEGPRMDDGMEAMIARDYGFRRIEYIHWIGSNASSILGRLRADGQEFIVWHCHACNTSVGWWTKGSAKGYIEDHCSAIKAIMKRAG